MLSTALAAAAVTPIPALGPSWLDPANMITTFVNWVGPWSVLGVFLVVFAETGLLIGFFLPGDSLLFTLGMFVGMPVDPGNAAAGTVVNVPLWLTCIVIFLGAFVGDQTGYWIGRKTGPRIFDKPDSRLFKQEYVEKTNHYFERFGGRTIILARFVPIVRTFAPVAAGVGHMNYKHFTSFSALGNLLWAPVCICLGHWLGQYRFVRENIDFIIIGVVLVSVTPMIIKGIQSWLKRRKGGAVDEAAAGSSAGSPADGATPGVVSSAAGPSESDLAVADTQLMTPATMGYEAPATTWQAAGPEGVPDTEPAPVPSRRDRRTR